MKDHQLAPKDLFEKMLEYMPIPTFDLIIEYGNKGIVLVKRKISPYKNVWALPGLRMYKGESIDDTLVRIANAEVGLKINPNNKRLLTQFVGKFKTESSRQDISTCYIVSADGKEEIQLNGNHFSSYKISKTIPENSGAMYRFYLKHYSLNKIK